MSIAKESGRLAWLGAALDQQRRKIARLLNSLGSLGPRGAMNPAIFRKFLGMLEQVAEARESEMRLIGRIEDIEQKHRFLRKNHKLKRARPRAEAEKELDFNWNDYPGAKKRSGSLVFWLIILWYLSMRRKSNQKKQGLTVD